MMQIIIDTAHTAITVKDKCFFIQNKSTQRQISPKRISSISITCNCTLNAAVIKLAAVHQVPILFFNNFGTIQARLWSPYFVNLANLRKKQLAFSQSPLATHWVIGILEKKTAAQMLNLQRLVQQQVKHQTAVRITISKIQEILQKISSINAKEIKAHRQELMGYEGSISRHYFKTINLFLPDEFKFERRSRRPALDYFNAGLNYIYGMSYSVVESGVFAKGLDPAIGFLHVDHFKRPTLVFDLIEAIRPIVDRVLIELIMNKRLLPDYFIKKKQGYWVGKKGKRIIISSFNDFLQMRITIEGKVMRFKDHIYAESNALGNLIDTDYQL